MGKDSQNGTEWLVGCYQRHVNTVYRVCYTFLRNAADAEDAVQSVFVKLLAKPQDFASEEHEKAWLISVASNHCKDILKSGWSKRTDLKNVDEPAAPDEASDETLAVVMSLPQPQRTCVYLYYYEGYNAAEIAGLIGRAHSTVRSYLSEARASLRKQLGGGFDE